MAAQRAFLAVQAAVDPSHVLPSRIDARRILGSAVAPPPAVVRIAVGIVTVEIRVLARHVDQARVAGLNGSVGIDHLARRVGGRGLPGGHFGFRHQQLAGQAHAVVEVPPGFAEPLPTPGVLHEIHQGRVLKPANAALRAVAGRIGVGAADPFAVRVGHADAAHAGRVACGFRKGLQGHEDPWPAGAGPAAAPILGVGAHRPIPLHQRHGVAPGMAEGGHSMASARGEGAPGDERRAVVAVGALNRLVPAFDLKPLEVRAGDEVQHPADGVRTVSGGGAVAQDLDALQSGFRQQVHIHQQLGLIGDRPRRPRQPTAVQQHQRAARPEAAQVDRGPVGAGAGAVLVGFPIRALAERQVAHEFDDARSAFREQLLTGYASDRQRRILRGARNPSAGDQNLLDFRRRFRR